MSAAENECECVRSKVICAFDEFAALLCLDVFEVGDLGVEGTLIVSYFVFGKVLHGVHSIFRRVFIYFNNIQTLILPI